jgi:ABC-type polysaccharide/polyol phosphate export systems, permease component
VGFSSAIVLAKWQMLYVLNPMVSVIEGFRWTIIGERAFGLCGCDLTCKMHVACMNRLSRCSHRLDGVLWPGGAPGGADAPRPRLPPPPGGAEQSVSAEAPAGGAPGSGGDHAPSADEPRPHQAAQAAAGTAERGALDQPGGAEPAAQPRPPAQPSSRQILASRPDLDTSRSW